MARNKTGKSKLNYYDTFMRQAQLAHKEAQLLVEVVEGFTTAKAVGEYLPRAHQLENEADELNHAVLHAIDVDFVTPFDRNDIIELTNALDDIVDGIEEVVQQFYMFDVHSMHPDVLPLARLLCKATGTLVESMGDFQNFRKFGPFIERIEKVSVVEEEADAAYLEVMRRLFSKENDDPVCVLVWMRIFDGIEDCADRIDDTAAIMGNIILKNS